MKINSVNSFYFYNAKQSVLKNPKDEVQKNYTSSSFVPCFAGIVYPYKSAHKPIGVLYDNCEFFGEKVCDITLYDDSSKEIKGYILNDEKCPGRYLACVDNRAICSMTIGYDERGWVFVYDIHKAENDNGIRGGGTELIKHAARKSLEKGYNGRIELLMAGSYPFYYKNNFRFTREHQSKFLEENALFDYMARNNIEKDKAKDSFVFPFISLSKDGAEALLSNRRYCQESESGIIFSLKKENRVLILDFVQTEDIETGERLYAIQLIEETGGQIVQKAVSKVNFNSDKNRMIVELDKNTELEDIELIKKAAYFKAKEFGIEKPLFC